MADQEKKALEIEKLDVTELEDEDLEGVAGGTTENPGCHVNPGCIINT
jgi:hypothetical protein